MINILNKIRKSLGFYTKNELQLTFELGFMLGEVTKDLKTEVTKKFMVHAEDVTLKQMKNIPKDKFASDMGFIMLSILETVPKDKKKKVVKKKAVKKKAAKKKK